MKRLMWMIAVVVLIASVVSVWAADAIRLREAKARLGQEVTVRARTGVIVESAPAGMRVYTLRDDYGDQANVVSTSDYPIMGATYLVTGLVQVDPTTQVLTIHERSRSRLYATPRWLLPAVVVVVLIGVGGVALMLRRRALHAALPKAWGYAMVEAGPDRGKQFALRGDQIPVGREQDPDAAIALPLDKSVSKNHGTILRQGETVRYRDDHSRNGSFVGQQAVAAGQTIELPHGALLRLGPSTVLSVTYASGPSLTDTQDGTGAAAAIAEAGTEQAPSQH